MKRKALQILPLRAARQCQLQLPFALPPSFRIAHVSGTPQVEGALPVTRDRWAELSSMAPNALVGYGLDLLRFAREISQKKFALESLDYALFVLTDCGHPPLDDTQRVMLWQAFGLPAYELIVAPGCRLLGFECEAHEGWHLGANINARLEDGELVCDLLPLRNLHTGYTGEIDFEVCGCGRSAPRLKSLAPCPPKWAPSLAAVA